MKALVFNGPRDIRYEDFKDPERTIDNALILQVKKNVAVVGRACTFITAIISARPIMMRINIS